MSTERSKSKPRIALPLGDPAGIGPEIVLKVLADVEMRQLVDFHVVGEAAAPLPDAHCAICAPGGGGNGGAIAGTEHIGCDGPL